MKVVVSLNKLVACHQVLGCSFDLHIDSPLALLSDHQTHYRFLEACKLSLNSRAATETHARIIMFGYGNYPSLVACLISTYARCDRMNLARQILDQVFCWDFDLVSVNIIIESLMKNGECDFAKKVFYKMPTRDAVTWNSIIGGFVKNARFQEALRFFRDMLSSNVEPDAPTFASIMSGCARFGSLKNAQWVHALMVEKNIELNSILSAALVDMYAKCGRIQTAKKVFDSIRHNDVSVWNAMINGLASHGLGSDALALFSKMEMENVLPDSITFIGILTACSHCGLVEQGCKYFDLMRNCYSIEPQLQHYGAMVDLLGRAGLLEEAYAIIDSMPMEPDIVIWRVLLSACKTYKKPGVGEIAIAKISRLRSGDYVLLSNIYCSVKRWDTAERVREMMKKTGVRKNRGKSWVELVGVIHQFKAGDRSHPETEAIYRVLEGLIKRIKLEGFTSVTELVLMDVSEEEKEENLNFHSEKLALAYGILKTSPGTEFTIFKNLRICHDCHCWIKVVSAVLNRVITVRDRIRFHRFERGLCSCGDYW
jgi:pentatricopeptide repeat protein